VPGLGVNGRDDTVRRHPPGDPEAAVRANPGPNQEPAPDPACGCRTGPDPDREHKRDHQPEYQPHQKPGLERRAVEQSSPLQLNYPPGAERPRLNVSSATSPPASRSMNPNARPSR